MPFTPPPTQEGKCYYPVLQIRKVGMKPSKVMESGFLVGLPLSAVPLASPFPCLSQLPQL